MPEDKAAAAERKAFADLCKTGRVSPDGGSMEQVSGPDNPELREHVTWSRTKPRGGR